MNISFRAINEDILDSITKTGTVVFTNEKNLYIVKSDGSKLKITDNIFVSDETELESVDKFPNKIYITKNNWRMYTWDGESFKLLSGGGTSGGGVGGVTETIRETVTVENGQTIIKVPFSFPTGGSLKVYRNGVLQDLDRDYIELNSTEIEMISPLEETDLITFMIESGGTITLQPTTYNLEIIYNPDGSVQKEIYTGGVEKVVEYVYDEITKQVIEKIVTRGENITKSIFNYDENGKIISIDDYGTEIAVLTSPDGLLEGVKPFSYHLEIVYNPDGSVQKEIYTGDINRTVSYTYDIEGNVLEKVVNENGHIKKAYYNYDSEGNITSIVDEGTDLVVVEGMIGGSFSGSYESYDDTELRNKINELENNKNSMENRIKEVESKINEQIKQDKIEGQLTDSPTLKTDIQMLTQIVNDLIDNQEELLRRHQLDLINVQFKYDIALDMVGNQCRNYFIDVLQDTSNIEEMLYCEFNEESEIIK
jgi:hypothetical protein